MWEAVFLKITLRKPRSLNKTKTWNYSFKVTSTVSHTLQDQKEAWQLINPPHGTLVEEFLVMLPQPVFFLFIFYKLLILNIQIFFFFTKFAG